MPSADAETDQESPAAADAVDVDVDVDEARESLLEALTAELGDAVAQTHIVPNRDVWVRVSADAWADTADYLRNRQRFRFFDWLSAVDWLPSPFGRSLEAEVDKVVEDADADSGEAAGSEADGPDKYAGGDTRFQVLARVYNLATGIGLNVKADLGDDLTVGTWTGVYPGADWHEREAYEMFGITFAGHPHLRKLYLPGDFEGYPLRKDYPLLARLIKPWPGIDDVEPMPEIDEAEQPAPAPEASTENPEDAL